MLMWLPCLVLAVICIFFGVMASQIIIPKIIMPLSGEFILPGIWDSTVVALLILLSLILGGIIYMAGNIKGFRTEDSFIGGEKIGEENSYSVVEFYKTIRDFSLLSVIYDRAERKWFDLYEVLKKAALGFSKWLSMAHTGTLTFYAVWILAGLIIMLLVIL